MTIQPPVLRAATAADAVRIRQLVRAARLNPLDLDWRRFLVIADDNTVVAAAQLRPEHDGRRELASVVVDPAHRGSGYGTLLVRTWQARAVTPLYLFCAGDRAAFYQRCGFRSAMPADVPTRYRLLLKLARLTGRLPSRYHLCVMCWYPSPPGQAPCGF